MELTVSNEPLKHTTGLTEMHEDLKSSERFDGNLSWIPSSCAECIDGCVNCNVDSELVPLRFHCKEGFLDRC